MARRILLIPDSIYKGAGRCWVAIKDGKIVAIRYMGDSPIVSLADVGRKRWTRAARRAFAIRESELFAEFRLKARAELAELGEVVSGMASCFEFIPKEARNG